MSACSRTRETWPFRSAPAWMKKCSASGPACKLLASFSNLNHAYHESQSKASSSHQNDSLSRLRRQLALKYQNIFELNNVAMLKLLKEGNFLQGACWNLVLIIHWELFQSNPLLSCCVCGQIDSAILPLPQFAVLFFVWCRYCQVAAAFCVSDVCILVQHLNCNSILRSNPVQVCLEGYFGNLQGAKALDCCTSAALKARLRSCVRPVLNSTLNLLEQALVQSQPARLKALAFEQRS